MLLLGNILFSTLYLPYEERLLKATSQLTKLATVEAVLQV